jgi:protein arginine kinase
MRNLAPHRFVPSANITELSSVMQHILGSADPTFQVFKDLTNAERDYLVLARLLSPEFAWTEPGRALLLDATQETSVMVNEEDHLRIQVLSPGWSPLRAESRAGAVLAEFGSSLRFAWNPKFGFLAASPINCGAGRRVSAMFHLIGLAHHKRLSAVVGALGARGLVVRGLFGESSRAVGAFAQVSLLNGAEVDFVGACDYLVREERDSRASVPIADIDEKADQARAFAASSESVSLGDALRILAWTRWQASDDAQRSSVDQALTSLEIRAPLGEDQAARDRAATLRGFLKL